MPYRTVRVRAPLFMRHKGVGVYHVFKHDDADGEVRQYAYTFDPLEGGDDQDDGIVNFDARDLTTFDKAAAHDERHIKAAIRAALDKGEIAPPQDAGTGRGNRRTGTATCSLCGNPCDAGKAHLHQGGLVGDECCWDERLRASE